jgi:hypothetical protein
MPTDLTKSRIESNREAEWPARRPFDRMREPASAVM